MTPNPTPLPGTSVASKEGLSLVTPDGTSRFEVHRENGSFFARAERWIDGTRVQVMTALTDSQYNELMSFSAPSVESARKVEIERKWRPLDESSLTSVEDYVGQPIRSHVIQQGYLLIDATEVRLRRQDGACFLTLKSDGGLIRREIEIALTAEQCDALWPATEGRRLEKVRSKHSIAQPHGESVTVEVDRFRGAHAPLIVIECEFPCVAAANRFAAPECFGADVTESKEHKNKALVIHGVPRPPLSAFTLPRDI